MTSRDQLCFCEVSYFSIGAAITYEQIFPGGVVQGLRSAESLLDTLIVQRCRALSGTLPVFILALVGTIVWGALGSYLAVLQPLFQMITALA